MKLFKKFIPLMLVTLMLFSNVLTASAAPPGHISSTTGGTWRVNSFYTSPDVTAYDPTPRVTYRVIYLSNANADALDDVLDRIDVAQELINMGIIMFTSTQAAKLNTLFGVNVSGLVGLGWTCVEIGNLFFEAQFKNSFSNARLASNYGPVKYVTTMYSGVPRSEFQPWDGYIMPYAIDYSYAYQGYSIGSISIGDFDFFSDDYGL
jgi:VanZ family protein